MIYIKCDNNFFVLNRVGKKKTGSRINWTEEQINFIIEYYKKKNSVLEIAQMFDTSQETIRKLLHKNNIKTKSKSEKAKESRPRNSGYFKIIDTPDKAYWLGFLYADGGIQLRNKSYSLRINLKKEDDAHLYKFLKAIDATSFKIKYTIKKTKDKIYEGCYVSICDKEMVQDLIDKGCAPRKSLILKFPNENQVPNNLLSHFIRGYFDGDGSISYRIVHPETGTKYFSMNILGTLDFLTKVKEILEINHIKLNKQNKHYSLPLCGNNRIYKVLNIIYKDSNPNIELTRKREKFDILSLERMGGEPVNTGCV